MGDRMGEQSKALPEQVMDEEPTDQLQVGKS